MGTLRSCCANLLLIACLVGTAHAQLPTGLPHLHATGLFPEEKLDADGDSVPDIDDNCPATPARVMVFHTVYDTPVDSCGCPQNPCSVVDTDKDGVFDCYDQCPRTAKGIKVGKDGCPLPASQPLRFTLDVKFEFAKANILGAYVPDLDRLRRILLANPETSITLEGHTDSVGSEGYNQSLSEARAQVCRLYLLADERIAPERVKAIGYGESQPLADNGSDLGRARNRRTMASLSLENEIAPPNSLEDLALQQEQAAAEEAAFKADEARRQQAEALNATPLPAPSRK